jgi:feruloyl esterase
MRITLLIAVLACSRIAVAATCESLSSVSIPNTTIDKPELVAAGAFLAPPGRGGGEGGRARFDDLPAFCRVAATSRPTSDSEIKIEVWLPVVDWNGKLRGTGNGGLGGTMEMRAMR